MTAPSESPDPLSADKPAPLSNRVSQDIPADPMESGELVAAEVVEEPVALSPSRRDWMETLSRPHLGWALFWVFVIFTSQLGFGIVHEVGKLASGEGLSVTGSNGADGPLVSQNSALAVVYATFTTMLTAFAIVGGLFRGDVRQRLGLRSVKLGHALLAGFAVLPLAVLASEVTNCASEFLPQLTPEIFEDFGKNPWWIVFLGACLFPGVGEEFLFRGFLGRGLLSHHGLWAGVAWTSALFGLIHVDPVQGCGAMFLGFGLHGAYLATRSLTAPILMHVLNNAMAFAAMKYAESFPIRGFTAAPDGEVSHTPWYMLLAAALACAACGWVFYQSRARWWLPNGEVWSPGYVSGEAPPKDVHAELRAGRPSWPALVALLLTFLGLGACLYVAHLESARAG